MTAAVLQKNMSFLNNTKGETIAVQIDLKSEVMRRFFEDLIDTVDVIDRQNEPTKPYEQVKKEILESRKNKIKWAIN